MMVNYLVRSILIAGLQEYRTQTPYIQYIFGPRENLPFPGAGDLLATVLDVSIVALAIPMFNHRAELKRHVRDHVNVADHSISLLFCPI